MRRVRSLIAVLFGFASDLGQFLRSAFQSRTALVAENLFLRKQLAFYREHKVRPRRMTDAARLSLVLLSRLFDWRKALVVVKPDTLIGWHRKGFKLFWRWKSRPGRPALPLKIRELIARMALENPTWGQARVAAEFSLKLGLFLSPRTVREYWPWEPSDCRGRNAPPKSLRIFDVNLRQSFYDQHVLSKSLRRAHIVKLNDQELPQVSRLLNLGAGTEETLAKRLLNEYGLLLVCITRGALGSILVSESQTVQHGGFRVKIADAIGAGDAFTACLAHYYVREHSLEDLSELANRFASWVATQRGATPRINASQLQDILAGAIR